MLMSFLILKKLCQLIFPALNKMLGSVHVRFCKVMFMEKVLFMGYSSVVHTVLVFCYSS